jgi:hypothetical protein
MVLRAAWFIWVHGDTEAARTRIFAHTDLPALRSEGDSIAAARHHPFRCELFHNGDKHKKCCRPSHLAFGSEKSNTGTNGDLFARESFAVLRISEQLHVVQCEPQPICFSRDGHPERCHSS